MSAPPLPIEHRVAVLVDCDNTTPEILEYALRVVAQFGRVVLRRGYGNHSTLAKTWQEVLVRQAFTPCLQYQYAAGKNTADIALALDALEAMFDHRADKFCLVTSDSDFTSLVAGKDIGCTSNLKLLMKLEGYLYFYNFWRKTHQSFVYLTEDHLYLSATGWVLAE